MKSETGAEISSYKNILMSSGLLRGLVALMLVFMCFMRLVATYAGLDQPVAMDQAQIAREVANGNGFTTKFLRPKLLENKAGIKLDKQVDIDHLKDTIHAPLNICAMAAALKITGYNDFDAHRMTDEIAVEDGKTNKAGAFSSLIYGGDRVISSVSMFFFIIAVVLTYMLGVRMFDEMVGACSATFMIFSSLMLDYATSGLPQMLMLCCMLGSVHCILSAVRHNEKNHAPQVLLYTSLAYVCITLLCLTGWMGVWCAVGLIVFCGMYFRPFGAYAIPGFIIICLGLLFSIAGNMAESGRMVGDAYYGIYDGLGSGYTTSDVVLRSTGTDNQDLESANFVLRLIGYACSQFSGMYANTGAIIVAPFFFLALLNRYKSKPVDGVKWAVFTMWCFSCLGMAIYGVDSPFNASQLGILFAPFFTIYGITLVFNFIARFKLSSGQFTAARGLGMFFMILISSGPLLASLPADLWNGFRLRTLILNQEPTYVPPALNINLHDRTAAEGIIITDQPWAVAWYANRKALWMPLKSSSYTEVLGKIIDNAPVGTNETGDKLAQPYTQGVLTTPISRFPVMRDPTASLMKRDRNLGLGGMAEVARNTGDFYITAIYAQGANLDNQTVNWVPLSGGTAVAHDLWKGNMYYFEFPKQGGN